MNVEYYDSLWEIDHCYPLSKTDLCNGRELYKSTNWTNLGPMFCSENISKKAKFDHRLFLMQEMKTNYFLKLND